MTLISKLRNNDDDVAQDNDQDDYHYNCIQCSFPERHPLLARTPSILAHLIISSIIMMVIMVLMMMVMRMVRLMMIKMIIRDLVNTCSPNHFLQSS